MSDIFNPIGRSLPGISGPSSTTGVVSDASRGLIGSVPGTILKGTVLGRGTDGLLAVATDKGTVNVATNASLPAGSRVTLEVRAAGDRLQVLILAAEAQNRNTAVAAAAKTPEARQQAADGPKPPPAQSGASGAGGSTTTGASGVNQAGVPAKSPLPAAPSPPPQIEIVGSSVKGLVVQPPAPGALLTTPLPDDAPLQLQPSLTPLPTDVAQKTQLLAQTQQLLDTLVGDAQSEPGGTATAPGTGTAAQGGAGTTPLPQQAAQQSALTALPPAEAAKLAATLAAANPLQIQTAGATQQTVAAQQAVQSQGVVGTLQPEVAQRIAALFAATGGEAVKPVGTPAASGTPAFATLPPSLIANATAGATGTVAAPATSGAALAAAAKATGQPVPVLATGTELTLHVVAVLPAPGGEIEIAPDAARLTGGAAPLLGRVLGYTPAGHAVIETPAGLVMMQQKSRLPVGAQIALVIEPQPAAVPLLAPTVASPQQALLALSSSWPSLEDFVAILRAGAASADTPGQPPPPPGLPQTGPKLAAGLANAISALRAGDIERLLGALLGSKKPVEGKEELQKRLKEEFGQLSELAKDRPGIDWRALYLPLYDPRAGLTQINLYYRPGSGGGEDDEPERKDRGTRFLVEVNFAALGAFQLDGLVRNKRFDLMIRSRRALSPGTRREIMKIFEEALELGGSQGGLEFRKVETFPVSPLDELRPEPDHFTA
jgi:hypothetical protein